MKVIAASFAFALFSSLLNMLIYIFTGNPINLGAFVVCAACTVFIAACWWTVSE